MYIVPKTIVLVLVMLSTGKLVDGGRFDNKQDCWEAAVKARERKDVIRATCEELKDVGQTHGSQ